MITILGLAAFVALISSGAAIEMSAHEKGDHPNKQWTDWPPRGSTNNRQQTSPDKDHTTTSPGGPLFWMISPTNQTAPVGSNASFGCSAFTYYHDHDQVHLVWLWQDDSGGSHILFHNDERHEASYSMNVTLYWSSYFFKSSTLIITRVRDVFYGKYTCHVLAENGHNELKKDVHLLDPALPQHAVCQPGWSLRQDHCYAKIKHPRVPTWREANSYCRTIGVNSTLTSIHDLTENQFLDLLLSYPEEVWIGYYYHQHNHGYYWNDGTDSRYENWDFPYPSYDEDEGCVLMNSRGQWTHVPCDGGKKTIDTFICKAPAYAYILAEPDDDCPWNWVGYRDNCYYIDPDSSDIACHDLHYYASTVYIQSPDENDFILKLIKEKSVHQAQGTVRLHAYHDPYKGWKWYGGVYADDQFYFKNWDANDILDMSTNAEGIDLDMETGVWRSHTASGVGMGTMCKLPKWASRLEKEVEKNKEGKKRKGGEKAEDVKKTEGEEKKKTH